MVISYEPRYERWRPDPPPSAVIERFLRETDPPIQLRHPHPGLLRRQRVRAEPDRGDRQGLRHFRTVPVQADQAAGGAWAARNGARPPWRRPPGQAGRTD